MHVGLGDARNRATLSMNSCNVWELLLLMCIAWSLDHGACDNHARRNELRSALQSLLDRRTPEQCPLAQELCWQMGTELESAWGLAAGLE